MVLITATNKCYQRNGMNSSFLKKRKIFGKNHSNLPVRINSFLQLLAHNYCTKKKIENDSFQFQATQPQILRSLFPSGSVCYYYSLPKPSLSHQSLRAFKKIYIVLSKSLLHMDTA